MDTHKQVNGSDNPLIAEALSLLQTGRLEDARQAFSRALEASPGDPEAIHGIGVVSFLSGQNAPALASFAQALDARPDNPVYNNNYGMALLQENRFFEAKTAFMAATRADKNYADAWANLGMTKMRLQEEPEEAEADLLRALSIKQDQQTALLHLAELCFNQQRFAESSQLYTRMAAGMPPANHAARADMFSKAAVCRVHLKQFDAAAGLFAEAARNAPENPEIARLLGESLGECGDLRGAKASLQKSAALKGGKRINHWKHLWYCPPWFPDEEAIETYRASLETNLDIALAAKPTFDWRLVPTDGFSAPFALSHLMLDHRPFMERYARLFEPSFPFDAPLREQRADGMIRVGFFVPPGQEGGFARLLSGIIRNMDGGTFERVILYPKDMAHLFAHIRGENIAHAPYAGTFETIVNHVRAARCDILYHWKAGETPFTLALPLCRTAPVQCTSWGTHGTSGMRQIDYTFSWDAAEPSDAQSRYTEKLILLPTPPVLEPSPNLPADISSATKAALGLPRDGTLFFCPHRPFKYHPAFDAYLRDILLGDETAHILLLLSGSTPAREGLRQRILGNVGPKAARRLMFTPQRPVAQYYHLLAASDVILDSPAYAGSLSGFDAFALGKPVVTQEGPSLLQRYTAANYRAMRLYDAPVATNRAEYVAHALRLAEDVKLRTELGEAIRNKSTVFQDTASITRAMEDAFKQAVGNA